ncbi:proteophosphoglycan ppg4 [Rhodotorula toruloides]|uniref:Proteophosphoglycan ppg4 n=1 Tax=Rhodotorula toruloides TaxID=5286 RepID=A0A511K8I5_RHOTO|nr:proteophosphoglycan ppg4 [Rhodotorula toruloides]
MGKVRHRKRTRDARVAAASAPLTAPTAQGDPTSSTSNSANGEAAEQQGMKKGARRDKEMGDLLDKLRSLEGRERAFTASTISSLILTLPPLQLRLLLSRNLIGLLIERLSALSAPSATSAPPPYYDLTTAIESLGALRNLAVSSPPHILSEMHNKRLLLPLTTIHNPLLAHFLPSQLGPAPQPQKPTFPATPEQRRAIEDANEAQDTLRRSFWDWSENVFVLLWCLAESNTKILGSLNAHAQGIIDLCMGYLAESALGIEGNAQVAELAGEQGGHGGMHVESKKPKKKDVKKEQAKKSRVPLFVAVAAAQALYAFVSDNHPAHTHLLSASTSFSFSPALASLLSILLTPSSPVPTESDDWAQLRVLAFGTLLEIAKGRSKRRDVETVRDALRSDEAQEVLLGLVKEAKLEEAVEEAKKDPTAPPPAKPDPSAPSSRLASLERQSQTLQLALEVLSEWLASGVPDSSALAAERAAGEEEEQGEEGEEEWGGISMDVEGDVEMGSEEDEDEGMVAAGEKKEEADGIIRRRRGDTPVESVEDAMLDDLEATVDSDDEGDDAAENGSSKALALLGDSLPLQLLALARPTTALSFLSLSALAPHNLDMPASSNGLISTSASDASLLPSSLSPLSEAVTTIHVRALEALNNLYITLSRAFEKAKKAADKDRLRRNPKELQKVFETALELVMGALEAADKHVPVVAQPVQEASGKKGKKVAQQQQQQAQPDEVEEVQERRMEIVMAGSGVVWGCARLGLSPEPSKESIVVGPDTTPFLMQRVYPSAFAAAQTPAGEAIRVRTLGALGEIGRRADVREQENAQIGRFMLSLLPTSRAVVVTGTIPPKVASTPDILLQAIDSFIDLYADEDRSYDIPVFRQGQMLEDLDRSVQGVRAAIKKVDRNKFPELRARADGALENLAAFIQYRKDVVKAGSR